ncbi:MAG: hypothetical protein ACE5JD_12525 [Candidatus Methylomirabilia bacterium]
MTRRSYYSFERRRKEQDRRTKREAKRQRKMDRAERGVVGPEMGEVQETGVQPGQWEWFSPSRSRTITSQRGTRPPADPPDDWILLTDVKEDPDASS